mgnify:CR=1 FL=1
MRTVTPGARCTVTKENKMTNPHTIGDLRLHSIGPTYPWCAFGFSDRGQFKVRNLQTGQTAPYTFPNARAAEVYARACREANAFVTASYGQWFDPPANLGRYALVRLQINPRPEVLPESKSGIRDLIHKHGHGAVAKLLKKAGYPLARTLQILGIPARPVPSEKFRPVSPSVRISGL